MFIRTLSLRDFRSWEHVELELSPGRTVFLGANGNGKTNLLEAVGYLATLGSHRVAFQRDRLPGCTGLSSSVDRRSS